jgi:hypothetical protein
MGENSFLLTLPLTLRTTDFHLSFLTSESKAFIPSSGDDFGLRYAGLRLADELGLACVAVEGVG